MVHRIVLDYDPGLKQVRVMRPKSVALAVEALSMALQGLATNELRALEQKASSSIVVAPGNALAGMSGPGKKPS